MQKASFLVTQLVCINYNFKLLKRCHPSFYLGGVPFRFVEDFKLIVEKLQVLITKFNSLVK